MALALEGEYCKEFHEADRVCDYCTAVPKQVGKHRIKHTSPASSVRSILRVSYSKQRS